MLLVAFTHPCQNCGQGCVIINDPTTHHIDEVYCNDSCKLKFKSKLDVCAICFSPLAMVDEGDLITAFHLHPP